eukprot:TRINITY_DN227_c0_g1_i5.p1 TRINITY_DN227_c0_g1~~TRINITY_DN227_c0_g1_i5.p1  ORF type:complete len:1259 (+),score=346.33 TRINITY_DN227_c0_g1_i5:129-3905(+)
MSSRTLLLSFFFLSLSVYFASSTVINVNWSGVLQTKPSLNCTSGCDNICGNKKCEAGENACSCPCDCGPCCVDGVCRLDRGESYLNCPADCSSDLTVVVLDYYTGEPLVSSALNTSQRASVTCTSRHRTLGPAQVNNNANFTFNGLTQGYFTCTAQLEGYRTNSQSTAVQLSNPASNQPVFIPLALQSGTITGRVNSTLGESLVGAHVSCVSLAPANVLDYERSKYFGTFGPTFERGSEGPRGTFFFADVLPGLYRCTASLRGYKNSSTSITVTGGLNTQLFLTLEPLPGVLYGKVIERTLGFGIDGVFVTCSGLGVAPTAGGGAFSFRGVALNRVTCSVAQTGISSTSVTFSLPFGGRADVIIYVDGALAEFYGQVTDSVTNDTLFASQVSCVASGQIGNSSVPLGYFNYTSTDTDEDGNYRLRNLPGGTYSCYASHPGYENQVIQGVFLQVSASYNLNFQLTPVSVTLCGVVRDSLDKFPVTGALVKCVDKVTGRQIVANRTETDGSFYFYLVNIGTHPYCTVEQPNYEKFVICDRLGPGHYFNYNITLNPLVGSLSGSVRDKYGYIVAGANVTCINPSTPQYGYWALSDKTGAFRIKVVRAGTVYCFTSRQNFYTVRADGIPVYAGEEHVFYVVLNPLPATIQGRVFLGSVNLLIPANVTCVLPDQSRYITETDFLGLWDAYYIFLYGNVTCMARREGYIDGYATGVLGYGSTTYIDIYIFPFKKKRSLGGKILDELHGSPIKNAVVKCDNGVDRYAVQSNSLGDHHLEDLTASEFNCRVSAPGYEEAEASIDMNAEEGVRHDFKLRPYPSTLSVSVLDNEGMRRLPMSKASVSCSNSSMVMNKETGLDGLAQFTSLVAGQYECKVSTAGYESQVLTINLSPNQKAQLTVMLNALMAHIRGTVFSSESSPEAPVSIASAHISIYNSKGKFVGRAMSGADGMYAINLRVPETYQARLTAPLHHPLTISLGRLTSHKMIDFTLLPSDTTIEVRVQEEQTGEPVSGALIKLMKRTPEAADQLFSVGSTNAEGTVTFTDIPLQSYFFALVSMKGYDDVTSERVFIDIAGQEFPVEVTLSLKPFHVRGKVLFASSSPAQPAEGCTVHLLETNSRISTDESGVFVLPDLAEGKYTLLIQGEGHAHHKQHFEVDKKSAQSGLNLPVVLLKKETGGFLGEIKFEGTEPVPVHIEVHMVGMSSEHSLMGKQVLFPGERTWRVEGLDLGFMYELHATADGLQPFVAQASLDVASKPVQIVMKKSA